MVSGKENSEVTPTNEEMKPKTSEENAPINDEEDCMYKKGEAPGTRKRRKRGCASRNYTAIRKNDFRSRTKELEDGVICALAVTHYLVDEAIGATNRVMEATRFAFDTGTGVIIINQWAIPPE